MSRHAVAVIRPVAEFLRESLFVFRLSLWADKCRGCFLVRVVISIAPLLGQ